MAKVTTAMATVHRSTSARVASTYAAPAIAPVAAAETPSTNALMSGWDRWRRKYGAGRHDEQVDRQEHAERRHRHSPRTSDQIADECDRDDDGARRDHRDGDSIEKLAIVEPAVRLDELAVEEWDDREAAAEHECAGLGEQPEDVRE